MNLDGAGAKALAYQGDGEDYSYSADGKRIVFSVAVENPNNRPTDHIYTMDSSGGNVKQLTKGKLDGFTPSFSPDGKRIVFVSLRREGYHDLYIMNSDGTKVRALTKDAKQEATPRFSPDGKHIVYSEFPEMHSWDIFVMKSDGTMRKNLTKTPGVDNGEHSPSYSPDGRKIVFLASRKGVDGIYIMNSDGTGVRRLVPRP